MGNIQLAKNLYTLRRENKLTQDFMSSFLSVSRQAYSNYETGKREPDLDSMMKLTQLYSVSLDQLVNHYIGSEISESEGPYQQGLNIANGDTLYLSASEVELLANYRTLTQEEQIILLNYVNTNAKKKKQT